MSEVEADKPDELAIAISTAKNFLRKAYAGERIENLGLEEVQPPSEYDSAWRITLGFDRGRQRTPGLEAMVLPTPFLQAAAEAAARPLRVYKVVEVDTSVPKALSMVNRKDD